MKIQVQIKALVMDVDGTLTDGGIYISNTGELMKRFHAQDGYGIHELLPQMGILPIIITGRTSEIVANRCKELNIAHVIQGSCDKVADLKKILLLENIMPEETAYMGDDMNDFECMKFVGTCGCPSDAVSEIKRIADCITKRSGGNGAVREFIEWIRKGDKK